jgi:hypothetical protein
MFDSDSSFSALVTIAVGVVSLFMASLSFVESKPEPVPRDLRTGGTGSRPK